MSGFRIGPMDTTDVKAKGTYLVGHKEEGHTIENKRYKEETVFVKKVSFLFYLSRLHYRKEQVLVVVLKSQKSTAKTSCRENNEKMLIARKKVMMAKTKT